MPFLIPSLAPRCLVKSIGTFIGDRVKGTAGGSIRKEETTMWCRLTFVKIHPEKIEELRRIFDEEVVPVVKKQKGNIEVFLAESAEVLGDGISFTSWETKQDADAYQASGTYKELVDKCIPTHISPPKLVEYEVKTIR